MTIRLVGWSSKREPEEEGEKLMDTHLCGYWMVGVDAVRVVRVERGGL